MLGGDGEAVADGGEVARAAAVERQARQRAGEIGRRGKVVADRRRSEPSSASIQATASRRRSMTAASVEGPASRRARSRAPAPVTVRSMAASRLPAPLAGERRGQFEIGAGRGVDQHDVAGGSRGPAATSGGRSPIWVFST